jgi:hypothetical protein
MLTATITNVSGEALPAGSLPGMLSWVGEIANSGSVAVVVNVADLNKVVNQTSGFSLGEMLQQMVQAGKITVTYANVGATDRDNVSVAHGVEA